MEKVNVLDLAKEAIEKTLGEMDNASSIMTVIERIMYRLKIVQKFIDNPERWWNFHYEYSYYNEDAKAVAAIIGEPVYLVADGFEDYGGVEYTLCTKEGLIDMLEGCNCESIEEYENEYGLIFEFKPEKEKSLLYLRC